MRVASKSARSLGALGFALVVFGLSGCAHSPGPSGGSGASSLERRSNDTAESRRLMLQLTTLAWTVRAEEAKRVASCAYDYSRQLSREYRAVRPAVLHNFLVNVGIRKRGLCYQWTEDLLAQLQTLNLISLELRWGMARAGTVREHNCIVVTARGQPFAQGVVLDAWRRSGRLVWSPVSADKYPWVEGEMTPAP